MPNPILHKRSSTAGVVPHAALLANGEIALNSADGTWFIKKTDGTVLDLRQPLIVDGGSASNPDAQDWAARVTTAGGTVSTATLQAVNNFCNAINAAGIRDRFYRLNLFCGNNLAACLVPLYRGQSLGGTQFGNATDTNVNFASGDFNQNDGLLGATNKYLQTGVTPDAIGVATGHLSLVVKPSASGSIEIGSQNPSHRYVLAAGDAGNFVGGGGLDFMARSWWGQVTNVTYQTVGSTPRPGGHYFFTRTSSTRADFYLNGTSVADTTTSVTPGANSLDFWVFATNNNGVPLRGGPVVCRGYSIGAAMTATQVAAYNTAMTAFQTALLRNVAPVVSNADAQDWVNRVYAAGGTVSQSTAAAVNTFCNTINSTGLRDRFYRLNLFCGNDLTACLVPLYRGQSLGGTQYGNATDTNFNFVASDYVASAGLIATGANGDAVPGGFKRLDTGLAPSSWPAISSFHASAFVFGVTNSAGNQAVPIGVRTNTAPSNRWGFDYRQTTIIFDAGANLNIVVGSPVLATTQHWLTSRSSVSSFAGYINGLAQVSDTTDVTASLSAVNLNFSVFAQNQDGSFARWFGLRLGGYSLGAAMTATQAAAFSTAMTTFQLAINRAV